MSNSRVYAKLLGLVRFKGTYETKNSTDHDPEKLLTAQLLNRRSIVSQSCIVKFTGKHLCRIFYSLALALKFYLR